MVNKCVYWGVLGLTHHVQFQPGDVLRTIVNCSSNPADFCTVMGPFLTPTMHKTYHRNTIFRNSVV